MKKFDLDKAYNGAKVVTSEGKPVRIVDWHFRDNNQEFILAVISDTKRDYAFPFTKDGHCVYNSILLMMDTVVVNKWTNIYHTDDSYYTGVFYDSIEEAYNNKNKDYVDTIKLQFVD